MTTMTAHIPAVRPAQPTVLSRIVGRGIRRPFFALSFIVTAAFVLSAIFAPWVAPYSPTLQNPAAFMSPPSAAHWLGTDSFGQDLLSRIIYGGRTALAIGFCSVLIGALGGLAIGLTAGLMGGRVEWVLMRLVDSILALPALITAIALISILGQGVDKVILAVGVAMIGPFARVVRADVMQVKTQGYIEAARLMGIPGRQIIIRHILPNVVFPLAVQLTLRMSDAILVSSSLSFLSIGVAPPTPDWGLMISEGRSFVSFAPWISGAPGAALTLLLVSLSVFGDGIREEFDPRLRTAG